MPKAGQRVIQVVLACLVLVGLGACDSDDPSGEGDDRLEYVAMGDSYSAGPGIPKIVQKQCQRSDHNYPHLVAKRLDAFLVDVTCGGARTDAVLQSQVQQSAGAVQPPQISGLSADTDLVTIGLGVNDLGLSATAIYGCVLVAERDPQGAPCERAYGDRAPKQVRAIRKRLVDTIDAIASRAPDARIVVVGYPRLLPPNGSCPERFPLAEGDVDFVRTTVNSLIDAVAAAADDAGATYIDVAKASAGHDICSDDPWVNGKRAKKGQGAAYHPTPLEQRAVARLIHDAL